MRRVREIFTGTYASDFALLQGKAAEAMRYRNRLGRRDLAMLYNVSAEFASAQSGRPGPVGGVFEHPALMKINLIALSNSRAPFAAHLAAVCFGWPRGRGTSRAA